MFLSKICQIFYDVSAHNGMYQFIELNFSGETFGRNEINAEIFLDGI